MYFAVLQGGAEPLSRGSAERWTRRALVQLAAVPLAYALRGYASALRHLGLRIEGAEPPAPSVLCAWHRDLLFLMPVRGPRRDWLALPRERRVDPIARAAEALGFHVLREGFGEDGTPPRALAELVSEGGRALLAADGPHAVGLIRPEPVKLALLSSAPLVPVSVRAERALTLPGGMQVVLPGETVLRYGDPIEVRAETEQQATAALASALR
jgi:lysophospholipid acyltransferase (LPLAT)-like uncharacterized protein